MSGGLDVAVFYAAFGPVPTPTDKPRTSTARVEVDGVPHMLTRVVLPDGEVRRYAWAAVEVVDPASDDGTGPCAHVYPTPTEPAFCGECGYRAEQSADGAWRHVVPDEDRARHDAEVAAGDAEVMAGQEFDADLAADRAASNDTPPVVEVPRGWSRRWRGATPAALEQDARRLAERDGKTWTALGDHARCAYTERAWADRAALDVLLQVEDGDLAIGPALDEMRRIIVTGEPTPDPDDDVDHLRSGVRS